jgi:hypothetical protein
MVSWIKVLLDTGVDPDAAPDMDIVTAYRSMILADRPVSYWRLGEAAGVIAVDEMGVNDGTYINAPILADPALRATPNYIDIPDHTSMDFGAGPFSYECWFATLNVSALTIIGKGAGAVMVQVSALVLGQVTTNVKGSGYNSDSGAIDYHDGLPHHLVFTHDEFAVEHIWIDNADVTVQTNTNVTTNTGANLNIGRDTGVGNAYDGVLDEVAIYNYILTPAQVAAHYRAGT